MLSLKLMSHFSCVAGGRGAVHMASSNCVFVDVPVQTFALYEFVCISTNILRPSCSAFYPGALVTAMNWPHMGTKNNKA